MWVSFGGVRFGWWVASGDDWETALGQARAAEAAGWSGIWAADHFMPPAEGYGFDEPEPADLSRELGPSHECWSLLAGLAAAVPRVRLGAMVTGNTYRHPAVLANQVATIDHISSGRVVLGIGAGWQENEHQRYGIEYANFTQRFDKLEEACAIITSLFQNERTDFNGVHYQLDGAPLAPKPIQNPLPLMIGGTGKRRTLPIVARYANEWNGWVTATQMREYNALIDQLCEDQNRDPAQIQRSASVLLYICDNEAEVQEARDNQITRPKLIGNTEQIVEQVAAYIDAGTDELIIPSFNMSTPQAYEVIDRFITEIASAL